MGIFMRQEPIKQQMNELKRKEERFQRERAVKRENRLQHKLAEKIPPKLEKTLETAFIKAFQTVFLKGSGIVERTIKREEKEKNYRINVYTNQVMKNGHSLKAFSKGAKLSETKNLLLSTGAGVGMGVLGIGLPDIIFFTGVLLKSIYEISLHYGFSYDTEEEKNFILLLIQGALLYGEEQKQVNEQIEEYLFENKITEEELCNQMNKAAQALSKELLYMKFLQGIPIVGAVGGLTDGICLKQVTGYADMKYQKRFLKSFEKK